MDMDRKVTFTEGKILKPLILFALPVLFALFLQAMYGAVDLLIVGKFASSADVSAVSTGSQIMMTLTNLVSSFAMGTTILLGQQIGSGKKQEGGRTVGTAVVMFAVIALIMTAVLVIFAPQLSSIMNAPAEAFDKTVGYVRICGGGMLVIVAYNLIGCIFRGLGDSRTPLITVAIACVCNIAGDLLVSISFLIILAIVNSMGVTASAGVGVAEKVCAFIMLISSAFMQSISAFVAQNYGAGHHRGIRRESAGFLSYEYSAGTVIVPHRTGNSDVIRITVIAVSWMYAVFKEKEQVGIGNFQKF